MATQRPVHIDSTTGNVRELVAGDKLGGVTGGTATGEAMTQDQFGANSTQMTPTGGPAFADIKVKSPWADVRAYGATGDGSTDDTTAVQAALTASLNVFFPAGTYVCSNLTTVDGQMIRGVGTSSIVAFKTGSTGYLFEQGSGAAQFSYVVLDGGSLTDKSGTTSAGDRSGIHVSALNPNSSIDHCVVRGFTNIGIGMNGLPNLTYAGPPVVSECNIYYCFKGVDTGVGCDDGTLDTNAEYVRLVNLQLQKNRIGILVNSGNVLVSGCHATSNGYGIYVNGLTENAAHGSVVGSAFNHNTVFGIYAISVGSTTGHVFAGNQSFANDIKFDACYGITFTGNTVSGATITLLNGGACLMKNNFFISVTVSRTSDGFILSDNYKSDGTFDGALRDLVTATAGATTEMLVGGGASALPVWTTATGTGAPVRTGSPSITTPAITGPVNVDASSHSTLRILNLWNSEATAGGQGASLKLGGFNNGVGGCIITVTTNLSSNSASDFLIQTQDVGNVLRDAIYCGIDGATTFGFPIKLKGYNVAGLPTGVEGQMAYVTDALAPAYGVTIVGGGAVKTAAFYNGSAWVAH